MALAYRSRARGAQQPAVDWDEVDAELLRVNPAFGDPRFDSLKHVLSILGSPTAEAEVEEVRVGRGGSGRAAAVPPPPPPPHSSSPRPPLLLPLSPRSPPNTPLPPPSPTPSAQLQEQRAAIEALVESVVEGYHAGFNKSAHNYSQILRLFTDSRQQLESLRSALEAARRRLSAQSRHLQAQWRRDLCLSDALRLLGDIQGVAEVPAAVAALEEARVRGVGGWGGGRGSWVGRRALWRVQGRAPSHTGGRPPPPLLCGVSGLASRHLAAA